MQQGSVIQSSRKGGPDAWQFRWSEKDLNGHRVYRKRVIGTVDEYTDETSVRQAASGLLSDVNLRSRQARVGFITVDQLCAHFEQREMRSGATLWSVATARTYRGYIRLWIRPRWGSRSLHEIKAVEVEAWLRGLDLARGSRAKIRNVFSVLFNHACRHELFDRNPIRFVRQSAKRRRAPEVLTGAEIKVLVENLPVRERTLVLLAASTGLRQGELFGLKWRDVDFEHGELNVIRSIVCGVEGRCKTESSQKPVPMHSQLAGLLMAWRGQCKFNRDDDWVFASRLRNGQKPYWGAAIMRHHIQPVAEKLGVQKRIGWHTFRHTYCTLLRSLGVEFKVMQELMRHSSLRSTLDVYTQAVGPAKRAAQAAVFGAGAVEQAAVPDKVIAAMQAKKAAAREGEKGDREMPATTENAASARTASAKNSYAWEVADVTDRMTGKSHVEAQLVQKPDLDTRELLQVNATCDEQGMHWLVVYLSGRTPGTGLQLNYPTGGGSSMLGVGTIPQAFASIVNGVVAANNAKGPWVNLQVKLDDGAPVNIRSFADHSNYANLTFDTQARHNAVTSQNTMEHPLAVIGMGAGLGAATIDELARAKRVLVALPREDGSKMYLEIRPQDGRFQDFAVRCRPDPDIALLAEQDAHKPRMPFAFQGSVSDFANVLPHALNNGAEAFGLPRHSLDREEEYILEAGRLCASITPEIAARIQDPNPQHFQQIIDPAYAPCNPTGWHNVSELVRSYDHSAERGLAILIRPLGMSWKRAQAVQLQAILISDQDDEPDMIRPNPRKIIDAQLNLEPLPPGTVLDLPTAVYPRSAGSPRPSPAHNQPLVTAEDAVVLTPTKPSAERMETYTAPGMNFHGFKVMDIDTRAFSSGILDVDIDVLPNSAADGWFDLFPDDVNIPTTPTMGYIFGNLTEVHDVHGSETAHLAYRFKEGEVFALGLQGSWKVQRGTAGSARIRASVRQGKAAPEKPNSVAGSSMSPTTASAQLPAVHARVLGTPPGPASPQQPMMTEGASGFAEIQKQADALWKEKKFAEAVPLYDRACNAGNQAACTGLGWAYFFGYGVEQNDAHEMDLWTKACSGGFVDACSNVVMVYGLTGTAGSAKLLPIAMKGCDLGGGSSCFALAQDYWTGSAVTQDRAKAKQLFQRACDLGTKAGCDPKRWARDE